MAERRTPEDERAAAAQRLEAALRDNLRRRKAQARARDGQPEPEPSAQRPDEETS
jgi:hypothetical protein